MVCSPPPHRRYGGRGASISLLYVFVVIPENRAASAEGLAKASGVVYPGSIQNCMLGRSRIFLADSEFRDDSRKY
jgi:hypothetical protein